MRSPAGAGLARLAWSGSRIGAVFQDEGGLGSDPAGMARPDANPCP